MVSIINCLYFPLVNSGIAEALDIVQQGTDFPNGDFGILPGTDDAETGALVGALLGIRFWKAMLAIFIGVLISAAMMTGVAYGVLELFF